MDVNLIYYLFSVWYDLTATANSSTTSVLPILSVILVSGTVDNLCAGM